MLVHRGVTPRILSQVPIFIPRWRKTMWSEASGLRKPWIRLLRPGLKPPTFRSKVQRAYTCHYTIPRLYTLYISIYQQNTTERIWMFFMSITDMLTSIEDRRVQVGSWRLEGHVSSPLQSTRSSPWYMRRSPKRYPALFPPKSDS